MISILIPSYNTDTRKLARNLSKQVQALSLPCEIVIMDDGSNPEVQQLNNEIAQLPYVTYHVGAVNVGRTHARTALAAEANYQWLLFLDGDSEIPDEHFLSNYASEISEEHDVIAGGRNYSRHPPKDCRYALHWKYGKKREHTWRNSGNTAGFQTNNFLIERSVFLALTFPDELTGYGHEDTWMGIELEKMDVGLHQISNPVVHKQLETNDEFIKKSLLALLNLSRLSKIVSAKQLARHVKMYRVYCRLKTVRLLFAINIIYSILKKPIDKNLHSCNPSLFFFDLYRLDHFIKISW